jgi:hypothetical protein
MTYAIEQENRFGLKSVNRWILAHVSETEKTYFSPKYRYNSEILLLFKLPPIPTARVRKLIHITFYGES